VRACACAQIPSRGASTQQTTQRQRSPRTPQHRSCRMAQDQSCQSLRHGAVPKELPRSLKSGLPGRVRELDKQRQPQPTYTVQISQGWSWCPCVEMPHARARWTHVTSAGWGHCNCSLLTLQWSLLTLQWVSFDTVIGGGDAFHEEE